MRSLAFDRLGLVSASDADGKDATYYHLNQKMELVPVDDPPAAAQLISSVRQPANAVTIDAASVVVIEDGKRYRLPKNDLYHSESGSSVRKMGKTLGDFLSESLAIGAHTTASSSHQDYRSDHAVDGSLADNARWVGRNEGETWVAIDLGAAKTFRSIWVVSGWENRISHVAAGFDVQVRRGDNWETLPGCSVRDNTRIQREILLDEPVTAQNIRLTSSTDDFFRIYEVALFDRHLPVDRTDSTHLGIARLCREVATERDLLNVHGTFYELPARNAQGLAKIRPVSTHDLSIHDFCSHNGLLLLTGIDGETTSDRIFRSADGKAAVWAGVVDDLWKLGKPRGVGGPWKDTQVLPDRPSDPYLMTAYDRKTLTLVADSDTTVSAEIDVDGSGLWIPWKSWAISAGRSITEDFPEGFSAYWIRFRSSAAAMLTAQLSYR
jgi:hypothetical protein